MATPETVLLRALEAIQTSSLADFRDPIDWGQWCRNVANWALVGDEEMLDRLGAKAPTLGAPARSLRIAELRAAFGDGPKPAA